MNVKKTGTFIAALLTTLTIGGLTPAFADVPAHPLGAAAAAHNAAAGQDDFYVPGKPGAAPHEGAQPEVDAKAHARAMAVAANQPITRSEALIRAQSWIDEHVMYSQSAYHSNQYGRYRQDCSGFVSMAWGLDTSYTTASLPSQMNAIAWNDLQPGDALWRRENGEGHIALFLRWEDDAHNVPRVREEYNTGSPAVERPWNQPGYARSFTPMRYRNIVDDVSQPPALGEEGIAASASYRYGDQQHVFSKGEDGSLKHSYSTEDGTSESEVYEAELAGDPVAFVSGDTQHVFGRLTDGTIGHWYWYPTDNQPNFEVWGHDIAGNLSGYAFNGQQHIYARGTDGKLKHVYWTEDNGVEQEDLPQDIAGDPVAYVWGDQQHVFGRTPDGELGHWFWSPTDNEPNYTTWGGQITGNPAGYAIGDQQHVFARGTDGKLKHFYWAPELGVNQEAIDQPLEGDPIAYVWDDQQHVFARTPDGDLGHWYWTPTDNEPQYVSWGGQLAGNPTGFATGDHQNVYGRNADGVLQHWYWTPEMDNADVVTWND